MNQQRFNKRNKKPNAFLMFCLEFQQKMKTKGHEVPDMKTITNLAAPHWQKLSETEKGEYKESSLSSTESMDLNPRKKRRSKLNCFGGDIDELQLKADAENDEYRLMLNNIKVMIQDSAGLGELDDLVFYFISTSAFYEDSKDIYPAELAMSKFSLKEGVFDDIQIRINPGELPLGSKSQAVEKSQKCLKYPLPPKCEGVSDYMTILETMIKFLHPMKKLPIFFTDGNTRDDRVPFRETRRIVEKIFYESQEDDVLSEIKIYPIDELFFILQRFAVVAKNRQNGSVDAQFPSIAYAAGKFNGDDMHILTKGCDFHNDEDASQFCCLSKVRRFGHVLSKWCSTGRRFQLHEGRHHPHGYVVQTFKR